MMGGRRRYRSLWAGLGFAALVLFLVVAVLHPIWHLRVAFLALIALLLVGSAALMAAKVKRPAREVWVDWVALGTAGLALWWLFWSPRLILPFSLQVLCRILSISLSLVTAVALHRALPRHLHRLGALFPLAPVVLSFLLPLGPARWGTGPLSPNELVFAGRLLVARTGEGAALTYDFPRGYPVAVVGFSPLQLVGYPSMALIQRRPEFPQLRWSLTLAALESERKLTIATVYSSGFHERQAFFVQTDSQLLGVVPAPEQSFLAVYRDPELNAWGQRTDTRGRPVAAPIQLPGRPQGLVATRDGTLIAYVDVNLRSVWVVDLIKGKKISLDLSPELAAAGGARTYIHSLAIAPAGDELALGLSWKEGANCPGLVWRVDLGGNVLARLLPPTAAELAHEPFVSILRYSPDGKRLVAEICCFPSRLSVVDIDSGRVRNLPLGGRGYRDAAFSPDGRYLVATGYDGIYLWRIGR